MKSNRTIKELVNTGREERVYVYLSNDEIGKKFMQQAEDEGFTFGDGAKPTERSYSEVMAINDDITINFVNGVGRMAFGGNAKTVGGKILIRVDFEKYIDGESDYYFTGKH